MPTIRLIAFITEPAALASDHCRTPRRDKTNRWPDSESLRADLGQWPLQAEEAGVPGGPGTALDPAGWEHTALESLIGPETVAEVPMTGLLFSPPRGGGRWIGPRSEVSGKSCPPAGVSAASPATGAPGRITPVLR